MSEKGGGAAAHAAGEPLAAPRESEALFRAVFEQSPAAIGLFSMPEGRIAELNEAGAAIFGLRRDEAIGRTSTELGLWESPESRVRVVERLQAGSMVVGEEVRMRRQDGSILSLLLFSRRVEVGGRPYGLSTFQDITSRKDADERSSRLNADLERRVAARTEELNHARLVADQANQAKSEFLAHMSHEIRTPLSGVMGMLEMLNRAKLEKEHAVLASLAYESAGDLLRIVSDVLDISKIEAGVMEIEEAPISIRRVVEKACDLFDRAAFQAGVELTMFTDPMLPDQVQGDAARIGQILHNLIGNAIKFSSGVGRLGRVRVRATVEVSERSRIVASFEIADNGIGIDEAARARLFGAFAQADASINRRFGGTGLGLRISRDIARLMAGDISVRSEPGAGSTFTLRLPLRPTTGTQGASEALPELTGLTCLVVGEPLGLASDLAAYLIAAGAQVMRVIDLETGRYRYKEGPSADCVWLLERGSPSTDAPLPRWLFEGMRCVIVGRGRRRPPRRTAEGFVAIDGNVLHRRALLSAVAMAAGRVRPLTTGMVRRPGPDISDRALGTATRHLPGAAAPNRSILVVEDSSVNLLLIGKQLEALGYTADFSHNGREGLRRFEAGAYDLVLTDIRMPEMDGYSLASAIRSLEREQGRKTVPIIALTANSLVDEIERCQQHGMNGCLTKPANIDDIRTALEKWLPPPPAPDRARPARQEPSDSLDHN